MSTKEEVLNHLKRGNTITPLEALNLFRTMSLAEIVFQLRHEEGYEIKTEIVKSGRKHFARYSLSKYAPIKIQEDKLQLHF